MKQKRVIGIVLAIVAVGLFFTSNYISNQVAQGEEQIAEAQSQVDQGNSLFSHNPATKQLGNLFTKPAQKKINAGRQEVAYYANMAGWMQIGAIVCVIAAVIAFYLGRKRSIH